MLDIITFDAKGGGNILYKALAHPIASVALRELEAQLARNAPFALYDPLNGLQTLLALYPRLRPSGGVYTHDSEQVGRADGLGGLKRALVDMASDGTRVILALSFEHEKMCQRIGRLIKDDHKVFSLERAKIPRDLVTNRRNYLDKQNFATNFAFFRDDSAFGTRLVTANYWYNYGASRVIYWMRLYSASGTILAEWQEPVADAPVSIVIDSAEIRARFNLPEFCGQLFIHVVGAQGHDVVKYALDTYGKANNKSLSVTHDANAWPSRCYATLPAPRADEKVTLWIQNSHAAPITAHDMTLNSIGEERSYQIPIEVGPFASLAVDVGSLAPDVFWPRQFELRAGNHVVRPRYEITRNERTRIAHLNVERSDLEADPALKSLPETMGRGFLLPFPIMDPSLFLTTVQPTPMSEKISTLPVRVDVFDEAGTLINQKFLGNLKRDHTCALQLNALTDCEGHAELVYDFRDGGDADGWLHALMRYESRDGRHVTETSFGAHIFNTLMTWRSEPQSYAGPPPGLTTRLFLKLGAPPYESFAYLIYPVSWIASAASETILHLYSDAGHEVETVTLSIRPGGSRMIWPHVLFSADALGQVGPNGYVLIRDLTCRLFGYHGQRDGEDRFSLDHMFGF